MSKLLTRFESWDKIVQSCVHRIDRRYRPVCVKGLPFTERDREFAHDGRVFFRPLFVCDVAAFEHTAKTFSFDHVRQNPYGYSVDQSWANEFENALIWNMIAVSVTPGQSKKILETLDKHPEQF